ncbi:hypothetical protein H4R18_003451 [Coemansia javaensis]|uniref:Uncharacterized protein n=1 Tax=Coemansia javaensis TaxID=2761396 RepID=A0A9W8H918_9FUNG|nr:hypothetical protein H4R18_003451 [Coemansia javaensis]
MTMVRCWVWLGVAALLVALSAAVAPPDGEQPAMDRAFASLVKHAFGPGAAERSTLYYKTRFFTARLQSRMRYELQRGGPAAALSQDDAAQLNEMVEEMWLASRRLHQSWGCMSYDLALCDGGAAKAAKGGPAAGPGEQAALAEWEGRLGRRFTAGRALSRSDAEAIHSLAKGVQDVLLSDAAAPRP